MKKWLPLGSLAGAAAACIALGVQQHNQKPQPVLEQRIEDITLEGTLTHEQYAREPAFQRVFCYGTDVLRGSPCAWPQSTPSGDTARTDFHTFKDAANRLLANIYNADERKGFLDGVNDGVSYRFTRKGAEDTVTLSWYALNRPEEVDVSFEDPTVFFAPVDVTLELRARDSVVYAAVLEERSLALQRPWKTHTSRYPEDNDEWLGMSFPLPAKDRAKQLQACYDAFKSQIGK